MRLYLDDCSDSNALARALTSAGHEVHTPRTEGTLGIDDAEHLVYAAKHDYVIITKNPADFVALHENWRELGREHAGILLVYEDNNASKDMRPADLVRAIDHLVRSLLEIRNEVHILNHWR